MNTDDIKNNDNQETIDLSKINISSSSDNPPKDEKLLKLLKKAYQKKIKCQKAIVSIDLIKPFSDYKPVISNENRSHFLKNYLNLKPPELYIYQDSNSKNLIMSDDYEAYFMYKEVKALATICVIVGKYNEQEGITTGPEIDLKIPELEIITKNQ